MSGSVFATRVAVIVFALGAVTTAATAADFDWKKFQGKTITFLANNNPVSQALLTYKGDFEKLTGMTLKVDGYQEQQMRQRLVTVMNARSDEVDVFMSLPSREGEQFAAAGWYGDLSAMSKNEVSKNYEDDAKDISYLFCHDNPLLKIVRFSRFLVPSCLLGFQSFQIVIAHKSCH